MSFVHESKLPPLTTMTKCMSLGKRMKDSHKWTDIAMIFNSKMTPFKMIKCAKWIRKTSMTSITTNVTTIASQMKKVNMIISLSCTYLPLTTDSTTPELENLCFVIRAYKNNVLLPLKMTSSRKALPYNYRCSLGKCRCVTNWYALLGIFTPTFLPTHRFWKHAHCAPELLTFQVTYSYLWNKRLQVLLWFFVYILHKIQLINIDLRAIFWLRVAYRVLDPLFFGPCLHFCSSNDVYDCKWVS